MVGLHGWVHSLHYRCVLLLLLPTPAPLVVLPVAMSGAHAAPLSTVVLLRGLMRRRWETLKDKFLSSTLHPTANGGMQNGSSVGICTRCIHVLAHFACSVGDYKQNFCIGAQAEVY